MASTSRLLLKPVRVSLAIVVASVLFSHSASAQDTLRPNKTRAALLCVTDTWAVWRTEELVKSTAGFRAPSYVLRFYRQRLSEPEALLVHTFTDGIGGMLASVTKNGTVALVTRRRLSWHTPDGKDVVEQTYPFQIIALYPDGALRYGSPGRRHRPVYFVPFKNDSLDMSAEFELIPAARKKRGQVYPPSIVRHGNLLAWIVKDVRESREYSPIPRESTLYVYDLESGKKRMVKLSDPRSRLFRATAFDGDVVVAYRFAFDAITGKRLNEAAYRDRTAPRHHVRAIRNQIGYYIHESSLYATDLLSKDLPSMKLASNVSNDVVYGFGEPLFAQTDAGIVLWNGEEWETIPWLEEWPDKEEDDKENHLAPDNAGDP